jgi:hypothetical protein
MDVLEVIIMERKKMSYMSVPMGLLGCLLAFCLIGCGGGGGASSSSSSATTSSPTTKKWTVLIYLDAANDLQPFGGWNVNQMEQAGSTADVNVVVQWKQGVCADCNNSQCPNCANPSWKDTRRYYITKDNDPNNINSQLVQDMGPNIDMGDWHTLNDFINWGEKTYPANHYALIIWDHGSGWLPTRAGTKLAPRAVAIDETTNNEIETWQLSQALNTTTEVDDVIFDACLEQMAEIGYEIRNSAHYMIGSEQDTPGYGYYYNTFLSDLDANPSMSPADFGDDIVKQTINSYSGSSQITQSVVDLSQMTNVETKLSAFADALIANIADASTKQAATNAQVNAINYGIYGYPPENKDLWDYANDLKTGSQIAAVQNSASALQTAIQSSVQMEMHSSDEAGTHGLGIYVPNQNDYNPAYANLALSRVSDWPAWLQQQAQY